ncbi:restriction endonuclease subunit R [Carbonactinospora thermoautotrophica]|uniref:Restriction endonuclease subunit R n=1 Tax=Carbonactinospora thermoautotrophica TaxID=1469144 RepID=A0A132NAV9_9ACTN|nr:type I restriction endonuclease [Carbonactinospora thermoautotrophica]KWX05660.1 restriction endonuclease subunit R [Carbonactinospora thermoautotrophica]KWX07289.1 restriction endonuclease subunit R [Carbonactinospora thermoautotrophica]
MTAIHTEHAFEDAVVASLLASGWQQGDPGNYRRDLGLDTAELFTFIGATQAEEWDRLLAFHGGDPGEAQRRFAELVAKEIDRRGALDVLRRGVKDRGIGFKLAYFKPAHTIADDALDLYRKNRLTVVRQLRYSEKQPDKSLDLVLFVNGLPLATAELKNPLTGQTVEHAKHQYRHDRDPKELIFARRTLVHFAVDPDLVFVTTRLAGDKTRFLPFNTGSEGPGVSGGAGNPPAPPGKHRTHYLWERVWHPDVWLDLVRRFLHVADPEVAKGKSRAKTDPHTAPLIFPRFHQWHAVTTLADHAARHGSGHNYLVMHSAGSGKSNTIAWLAHRLSSLHTPADPDQIDPEARAKGLGPNQPVFDKVIVITDRVVLDRQLQETVFQFEHVPGVVQRIDKHSAQLAEALQGETAKIVITTLQKFPYVLDQVRELKGKRFAVIIDEAHSSQSGESAIALKKVLLKYGSDDIDEDADPLTAEALARGRHDTLSYFAFTATPKPKTLELFGIPDPVTGNYRPFHVYSMRQAIEEGFILDVLRNYITYQTYYRLASESPVDKEVERRKAAAQLARFAELHPTSMEQRAEIIIEHFRAHTADRLGGRAKAMVVTRSREHAVRMYQALREYVDTHGYRDCGVLVAFSQSIEVDGVEYTEAGLNGFPEGELPERFAYTAADDPHAGTSRARQPQEYRILVVAEKYQTGFDQPLLTTMYVDKPLKGVAAVQTLSRLNRTHPLKTQGDIFVLDFANEAEEIQKEFRPFYETAITTPTDPNLLYTAADEVEKYGLLVDSEMEAYAEKYLAAERKALSQAELERIHAELYRFTDAARDRYLQLAEDDPPAAEEFRSALRDYVRKYAFLSQVVPYVDRELERLYLFGRALLNRLPRRQDPAVDVGPLELTHLRISKTGEHDASLTPEGEQTLPGFTGGGVGPVRDPDKIALSELIEEFNQRYGAALTDADKLWIEQQIVAAVQDSALQAAAAVNDEENFGVVFDKRFEDVVIERHDDNGRLMQRFFDDDAFRSGLTKLARRAAYQAIRRNSGLVA